MRISLLIIIIHLFSMTSFAQTFTGGVKAGLIGAQVDGDGYGGYNKLGIHAGGYVNLQFTEMSAFQMELAYYQRGARKNPNYEKGDYEQYLLRTDYVDLFLLYQLLFDRKFSAEAGASAGFLVHTYEEVNEQVVDPDVNPFKNVIGNYIIGFNYFFNERMAVNFRVNNSFLNLRDYSDLEGEKRLPGDTYRFWHYGQFHVTLALTFQYQL